MAFTPFIPDTDQWKEYFLKQVSAGKTNYNNNNGNKNQILNATSLIGGGVTVHDESIKLTSVGKVKQKCPTNNTKNKTENVKVTITSPADVTLEQAESELSYIKEMNKPSKISSSKATKRKASSKYHSTSLGKKRKQARQTDVFSK